MSRRVSFSSRVLHSHVTGQGVTSDQLVETGLDDGKKLAFDLEDRHDGLGGLSPNISSHLTFSG